MRIQLRQIEGVVQAAIGKPLAWALYGTGVALAFMVVAIYHGSKWLIRSRKKVTWAK